MRQWAIAAGAAIGVASGVALGVVAWPIDAGRVQRDFAAAFGLTQAPLRATLTLLPRPTLRLDGVKGTVAEGAVVAEAAHVEATLRIDRLLSGAFAPDNLSLQGAEIHVDLAKVRSALVGLATPPFGRLVIQAGAVDLQPETGPPLHFDIADARLDWPSPGSALRGAATGRWRSQPVEATAEISSPLAAARGGASAVRASLDAPLAQLRFAGDWSPKARLDNALYRGQASALVPSITRFSRWIGLEGVDGFTPAGLELQARVSARFDQVKLADLTMTLGGQAFEGALDVSRTQTGVAASGTLAAETLDLEPLIGPPPALFDSAGDWSTAPALPRPNPKLDLDLRVSATRALWRGLALDNPAAAVSQRNGRLSFRLLEAGFARGALSGEMAVEDREGACESRISLSLETADLGVLLAGFGERNFTGQGGLKASIHARGRSFAEIVASADGDGSLEIANGALRRLNFEEALRRGQRKLIDVARDMAAGATRFEAAHGRVEISNGEARFLDATTHSAGLSLALTGAVDLAGRAWRARIAARQTAEDGQPKPDGAHLDFALFGPWGGAALTPLLPPAD